MDTNTKRNKWALAILTVCLAASVLCNIVLAFHSSRVELGIGKVALLVDDEFPDSRRQSGGRPVGFDYVARDEDHLVRDYMPSLGGLWMLGDEVYGRTADIVEFPASSEYLAFTFLKNGERTETMPNSAAIFRFDLEVLNYEPGTAPEWTDGEEVPYKKRGDSLRVYSPELNCVYVCRSVWDSGIVESAWIVREA